MNLIKYSYEESRDEIVYADGGTFVDDSYSASISVYGLTFEENKKLRSMIEEFCRGAE